MISKFIKPAAQQASLEDLLDDTPSISKFLARPPVMWSILAGISTLAVYGILQTDMAERRIAAYSGTDSSIRMANAPQSQSPNYSVDLALVQNELERTKAEIKSVYASRQAMEQKMALLESKFADVTGSIEPAPVKKSQPAPLEDKPQVLNAPQLETLPKIAAVAEPAKPVAELPKAELPKQEDLKAASKLIEQAYKKPEPEAPKEAPKLESAFSHAIAPEAMKAPEPAKLVEPTPTNKDAKANAQPFLVPLPPVKPAEAKTVEKPAEKSALQLPAQLPMQKDISYKDLPPKESFAKEVAKKEAELRDANLTTGSIAPQQKISISTPTRTLFAVSVGEPKSISEARSQWQGVLKVNESVLAGMEPYVNLEEKNKSTQLKLLVGPFRNAQEATQICGQLTQNGTHCMVSVFNGQRLNP